MRLLIYADLQATDGSESSYTDPTTTLQHLRVKQFFTDLASIYRRYSCGGIIDLGDTTDDRSSIPMPTIELLGEGLALLPNSQWNIKLVGNHEQYLRDASVNNRRLFEHKFTVVDQNQVFYCGDVPLVCCSYPGDFAALTAWLGETGRRLRSRYPVLFGHFQVAGCQLANGIALTGVPRAALKDYSLCLLGHIHAPQTLGDCIHYVGSPFQQDWGEAGQSKRVAILDTDTKQVTWVPMEGYPEYRRIDFSAFTELSDAPEDRIRVRLTDHAQTEQFFQHPRFHRAEAEYAYAAAVPVEVQAAQDWSFEGTCGRYMALVPPDKAGLNVTPDDLMDIGNSIARGECA